MSDNEFGFESLDLNVVAQEKDRLTAKNNSTLDDYVQMPKGEGFVIVRLLPKKGPLEAWCETRIHNINNKNIHCPRELVRAGRKTFWAAKDKDHECPICLKYSALWKKSETAYGEEKKSLQNLARKLKPNERFYWQAIVRKEIDAKTQEVKVDVGPKILSIGKILHGIILEAMNGNEATGQPKLGDVTHYKSGRDFRIVKKIKQSGSDEFPDYATSTFFPNASPLGTIDQMKDWASRMRDLSELRKVLSLTDLEAELHTFLNPEDDQSDSTSTTSSSVVISNPTASTKPKSTTSTVVTTEEVNPFGSDDEVDPEFAEAFKNV